MTVAVPTSHRTAQGAPLKSARERMDIISAYREVGSFRGAAAISGTTPKTSKSTWRSRWISFDPEAKSNGSKRWMSRALKSLSSESCANVSAPYHAQTSG